jgi:hypothetical protein
MRDIHRSIVSARDCHVNIHVTLTSMNEPPKLSLERPYKGVCASRIFWICSNNVLKDDKGEYILNVVDITQEGDHILEPCVI